MYDFLSSGLGMDVKSVPHLCKESRSLDIVRVLIWGDHTVQTTVQAKVQSEQKWTRKSAISVRATKIAGTILSSTEPAISNIAVVEPPLGIHDIQPQDPQPPQSPLHTSWRSWPSTTPAPNCRTRPTRAPGWAHSNTGWYCPKSVSRQAKS
jgi:hypothetical protein